MEIETPLSSQELTTLINLVSNATVIVSESQTALNLLNKLKHMQEGLVKA